MLQQKLISPSLLACFGLSFLCYVSSNVSVLCKLLGMFLNVLCEFLSEENLQESEVFNQLQWNCLDCVKSSVKSRNACSYRKILKCIYYSKEVFLFTTL